MLNTHGGSLEAVAQAIDTVLAAGKEFGLPVHISPADRQSSTGGVPRDCLTRLQRKLKKLAGQRENRVDPPSTAERFRMPTEITLPCPKRTHQRKWGRARDRGGSASALDVSRPARRSRRYGGGREPGYPGPPAQIRTCALAHTAPTLGG